MEEGHFRPKKQPVQSYGGVKTGCVAEEGRELEFVEHLLCAGALSLLLHFIISPVFLGKPCSSYFKGREKIKISD